MTDPPETEHRDAEAVNRNSLLDGLIQRTRVGQFVGVGALGATLETIIVAVLTTVGGTGALVAKVLGAEASISMMFLLNDRVTFATEGQYGTVAFIRRWATSHLVRATGLLVAFAVLYVLVEFVDITIFIVGWDLWPTVANVIGIGVGLVLNYAMEGRFTWRIHR